MTHLETFAALVARSQAAHKDFRAVHRGGDGTLMLKALSRSERAAGMAERFYNKYRYNIIHGTTPSWMVGDWG